MKRNVLGILAFAVTIAVLVVTLRFMNWLPTAIEQGTIRSYESVEEVRTKLGIRDIYVPSYFPETLKWPPSEVLAQQKPFDAVVMEFRRAGDAEVALVISQAKSADFVYDGAVAFTEVNEEVPYDLKDRKAILEAGICEDRTTCSRISWNEDGTFIRITMKSQPPQLIRLAESMLH